MSKDETLIGPVFSPQVRRLSHLRHRGGGISLRARTVCGQRLEFEDCGKLLSIYWTTLCGVEHGPHFQNRAINITAVAPISARSRLLALLARMLLYLYHSVLLGPPQIRYVVLYSFIRMSDAQRVFVSCSEEAERAPSATRPWLAFWSSRARLYSPLICRDCARPFRDLASHTM